MKIHKQEYGNQDYYYEHFYPEVLGKTSTGIFKFLSSYPHKLMEKPFPSNIGRKILEVGVGTGEHVSFVASDFDRYVAVDLSSHSLDQVKKDYPQIETLRANAEKLPFEDNYFDRVIATCLFAHLEDPEAAIVHWSNILKDKGVISIYLPSEPSLALRLFRYLLPRRKAKKMGFQGYDLFIFREHRSSIYRLLVLLKEYFHEDQLKIIKRPFPFFGWYFNLFYIVHITINKRK
jgi:phosphatidylethanolamine/phosphatidyl-N-methylethanolamine N-methyltransferase